MHLPRVDREEFMDLASLNLSPVDLDFLVLSDPAKSTRFRVPQQDSVVTLFVPVILNY